MRLLVCRAIWSSWRLSYVLAWMSWLICWRAFWYRLFIFCSSAFNLLISRGYGSFIMLLLLFTQSQLKLASNKLSSIRYHIIRNKKIISNVTAAKLYHILATHSSKHSSMDFMLVGRLYFFFWMQLASLFAWVLREIYPSFLSSRSLLELVFIILIWKFFDSFMTFLSTSLWLI